MACSLQAPVAAIFDQAQSSVANHRKNCVALYKLHVGNKDKKKDQSEFIATFLDMLSRVVVVKKGPSTVDRIIKFAAQYVRFVNEKAQEDKPEVVPMNSISSASTRDEDTVASVFVSSILEWVIQGFVAKNKIVRYQTVHLVAEMISFLGEVDEDSYLALRESLIERSTCDKESTIRSQAVSALARLIGSEDPSELQDGERSILEVLLDVMTVDPAADVRRAALLHVPLTAATLPTILARARDVDPLTRKLVYASVLTPRLQHPRHLTIAQREHLVQTGLGDREPAVRLAAAKMVAAWFELMLAADADADADPLPWTGDDGGIMVALIAFLTLFDVVGPGEAVAVDALLSLLSTRADLFDVFVFSEDYWRNLTPESAVLARAFLEACLADKREDRLESAALPVVTAFAFHMQEAYNHLLSALDDAEVARNLSGSDEVSDDIEEELAKREVVLGELLRMAVKLDYMDEIGRRKVYTVTRDILAHPQLPPGLIERCLDVLKEIMPTERELIRVVVEIVMDFREPEEEEGEMNDHDITQSDVTMRKERSLRRTKDRQEMTAEEAIRSDLTDIRCLALVVSMLERVHGNFEDNSTLEGILADLIIPAVRRKDLGIREKGLVALGLCCLIAKSIAVKSLQLFLGQIQNAPEQLKFKILQIVFDLMIMYDQQLWGRPEDGQAILTFLANTLEAEESPLVQAVLCVGLAKLLLAGLADDPKVLKSLLLAYVSPYTAGNSELRQCLSYFFSVYCYSSGENQSRLRSIFMPAFDEVVRMHSELGEDQTMVTPQQFGLLVVDWTDARKVAESAPQAARHVHADLAVDILLALYDSDRRSEDQEALCPLFSHLHIEGPLVPALLVKLSVLLKHIQTQCPFDDPTLDKAVGRFKTRFAAAYEADLDEVEWAEYGTAEMKEVYEFIGIDMPEWAHGRDDAGTPIPESAGPSKARKGKGKASSRSKSAPVPVPTQDSGQSDGSEEEGAPPSPTPTRKAPPPSDFDSAGKMKLKAQAKAPRRRSRSKAPARRSRSKSAAAPKEPEQTDDDDDDEEEAPPALPELKTAPPPSPTPTKNARTSMGLGDSAGEEEEEALPSPSPKPKAKAPARRKAKPPARRSRSKPAPEAEQASEDDEEAPPQPPPKAPTKTTRSRSKTTRRASDLSGSGDADSNPVPPARKSTRKAIPIARAETPPPPPQDIDHGDSDAENKTPVTPPKKANGRKRLRTPLASPADIDKKRRRAAAAEIAPVPIPTSDEDEFGGYSEI
ncbi:nuclear condensing complex subunit [Mycena haematopus]|nr:nuclear condensing complex subunit [Mycena haematopus]